MSNPAHKAALEYIEGKNARVEAMKISDEQIAKKFDISLKTVVKAYRGIACRVSEEDRTLIRSLKKEQQRLRGVHRTRLLPLLAHQFDVKQVEIKAELQKMGVSIA